MFMFPFCPRRPLRGRGAAQNHQKYFSMRAATGFAGQLDEEGQTLLNEPLLTDEIHHTREGLPQCPPGAVCEGVRWRWQLSP